MAYLNVGKESDGETLVVVQAFAFVPGNDDTNLVLGSSTIEARLVLSAAIPTVQVVAAPASVPEGATAMVANVYTYDTSGVQTVTHSFGRVAGAS